MQHDTASQFGPILQVDTAHNMLAGSPLMGPCMPNGLRCWSCPWPPLSTILLLNCGVWNWRFRRANHLSRSILHEAWVIWRFALCTFRRFVPSFRSCRQIAVWTCIGGSKVVTCHAPTFKKMWGWLAPCLTYHSLHTPPLVRMVVLKLEALLYHHWTTCEQPRPIILPHERETVVSKAPTWSNGH